MAKSKDVIAQIKKASRRKFSADEKIRIVLEGLRGEQSISEICRREGIAANIYYRWSKAFLEAGKNGLTRDTLRDATSDEVRQLKQENQPRARRAPDVHVWHALWRADDFPLCKFGKKG